LTNARLGPEGLGPIHVGMTIDAIEELVGHPLQHDNMSESDACREYPLAWVRDGGAVVVMTQDRRVTRVSVFGEQFGVRTAEGVGGGSTDEAVRAAYPNAEEHGAPYEDSPAHDLFAWRTPQAGLRFEVGRDGKVSAMHGGDESIRYIEGCL